MRVIQTQKNFSKKGLRASALYTFIYRADGTFIKRSHAKHYKHILLGIVDGG